MVPMSARRKSLRGARRREARAGGAALTRGPRPVVVATVAVVLAAAALVAYLPSLRSGFLNWDDDAYVTENRHVATGLSWDTVAWSFTRYHSANWHPLTWLSHAADVSLYGLGRPWGHHLTNILLHAANTVLLLVVLRRLTGRLWPSAVVAGLFALHPLHVESVAWIAERKDLLCALFMFLAVWAYAAYAARPTWRRYLLVAAAFAAALMSKPMAVTLPVVLLVLDYWPLGRLSRRSVLEKIPLFAMTVASCTVTLFAQQAGRALRDVRSLGLVERLANAVYAYAMYLVKMVWPWPGTLVPVYPLVDQGGDAVEGYLAAVCAVVLAGLTCLAVWQRRRRPYLLAGWLIYVVMLVPVIGLVQVGRQIMADRYTYVPLVGVFVAAVFLVAHLVAGRRLRHAAAVAAMVVLTALGVLAWRQQRVWADPVTFWTYVHEAYPRDSGALSSLGDMYAERGETAQAIACYRKAIEARPNDFVARCNLGNTLAGLGKPDEAAALYRHALEANPDFPPAHNGLGVVLLARGQTDEALRHFRRALELSPDLTATRVNVGNALFAQGDYEAALEAYRAAIEEYRVQPKFRPNMILTIENAGLALVETRDWDGAILAFREVLRELPRRPQAHEGLAQALQGKGRTDEAEYHRRLAQQFRREQAPPGR